VKDSNNLKIKEEVFIEKSGVYIGEWNRMKNKREGKGILFLNNGAIFQGNFDNDHADGLGQMLYPNKKVNFK